MLGRSCRHGVLLIGLLAMGCATARGSTPEEKRQAIRQLRDETIAQFYEQRPEMREQLWQAVGYGVFSNNLAQIIFFGGGQGYGVVTDGATGRETFMNMAMVGTGLGIAAKNFRAVFVFRDRESFDRFVMSGWEYGGHADAAWKTAEGGGAVSQQDSGLRGVDVYVVTKRGFALQGMMTGTKFWPAGELNAPPGDPQQVGLQ